jgi:hypothetical protein
MYHDASNVADDFTQHSSSSCDHETPCSVFAPEKYLNQSAQKNITAKKVLSPNDGKVSEVGPPHKDKNTQRIGVC